MMAIHNINKVGIIGSGKLGSDIFYYLLQYDFELVFICIDENCADEQYKFFLKRIARMHKSGLIDDQRLELLKQRVFIGSTYIELLSCDLIIECIWENVLLKRELFEKINKYLSNHSIISSNSSSINPTLLNPFAEWAERFIGFHFFYPVQLKSIVEIIKTEKTHPAVIEKMEVFCDKINKKPLILEEEHSFALNKLFLEVQNEAFIISREGKLTFAEIDYIVHKNLFPEGIFCFFDKVGIDIMLESIKNYIPPSERKSFVPLIEELESLYAMNMLGAKTGAGFYDYSRGDHLCFQHGPDKEKENIVKDAITRLRIKYINTANKIVENGVCSADFLDFAAREYINSDSGPFSINTNDFKL